MIYCLSPIILKSSFLLQRNLEVSGNTLLFAFSSEILTHLSFFLVFLKEMP